MTCGRESQATQSWRFTDSELTRREKNLTEALMKQAKADAIFMHCLPAQRGIEVTADVIDGPHSVVFDQAENRLHIEKALLVKLLRKQDKPIR